MTSYPIIKTIDSVQPKSYINKIHFYRNVTNNRIENLLFEYKNGHIEYGFDADQMFSSGVGEFKLFERSYNNPLWVKGKKCPTLKDTGAINRCIDNQMNIRTVHLPEGFDELILGFTSDFPNISHFILYMEFRKRGQKLYSIPHSKHGLLITRELATHSVKRGQIVNGVNFDSAIIRGPYVRTKINFFHGVNENEVRPMIHGGWGEYTPWSQCLIDEVTGDLTQSRSRVCDNPKPQNFGTPCSERDYDNSNLQVRACVRSDSNADADAGADAGADTNTATSSEGFRTIKESMDTSNSAAAECEKECPSWVILVFVMIVLIAMGGSAFATWWLYGREKNNTNISALEMDTIA
jgi:hypothetical protein